MRTSAKTLLSTSGLAALLVAAPTLGAGPPASSGTPLETTVEPPVPLERNEVLVTVHGIVCSFCAQGISRSLGKLEGLDRSKHDQGVLVDIDAQRVWLAFLSGVTVPRDEIENKIRKAGYDPIAIFVGSTP